MVIVNGILTGLLDPNTPPVWYNNDEFIGVRFLTIPIEDFLYSLILMYTNFILFEFFSNKLLLNENKRD
tara:strand:- start:201 stop:407 length:207 start_codon:yes stop_codon:yes gene_type:complete